MLESIKSIPWPTLVGALLALVSLLIFLVYLRRNRMLTKGKNRYRAERVGVPIRSEVADIAATLAPRPIRTVAVSEIQRDYLQRKRALDTRLGELNLRELDLEKRKFESAAAHSVLDKATAEERANLATILGLPERASANQLIEKLRAEGSHFVGSLFRRGEGVPYLKVVSDVATKLGVSRPKSDISTMEAERIVLEAAFQKVMANALPEQRAAILEDIQRASRGSMGGIGKTTAALAVANLSGFALYTAASTVLGAVTGALGLTLPFAAYMGLSSILSTLTGPVGWAALGGWALIKLGGENYKKTIPGVVLVATVRTRLIAERDQELQSLAAERTSLNPEVHRLERIKRFLDGVRQFGPEHQVPISDVPR